MSEPVLHALRVRLLGSMRAECGDTVLDLGSARRQAVFAILAMRAGQAVSRAELITGVWGDDPPATVTGSLYTYVSDLRRVLDPGRSRWSAGETLVSAGAGYCLRLDSDQLDVHRFERLRERAQDEAAREDWTAALRTLTEALGLWHGEALAGVVGPFAGRHRARLGELRLITLERRAEAMLAVGRHAEVIAELTTLVREHPSREAMRAMLMTALYRSGRSGEALRMYRDAQETLAEELGIEPGQALRRLRDQILDDDAALAGGRAGADEPRRDDPFVIESALRPPTPETFSGRTAELELVRQRVRALAGGNGGAVWVEGEPGIGKSTLLAAALDVPEAGSCQVMWGAGDELSQRFPLGMVLACVGVNTQSPDPRRVRLAADLQRAAPLGWRGDDPTLAAVDRLLTFVDRLCADGPVLLVLDDLQWADRASLLLWHRLARATRQVPLLLVCACRPVPRTEDIQQVRGAMLAAGGDLLQLDPLGTDDVADMAAATIGAEPGAGLLALAERAAGNPMYLREILDALVLAGSLEVEDGIAEVAGGTAAASAPASLASAVCRRLGFLSDGARELLRWAALLGIEFDLAELAAIIGKPASELVAGTEETVAAGVLREAGTRFAFRHPLVRQSLYDGMPQAVRVALHRQAAQTLDGVGADLERVAEQLLAAPVAVDNWVIRWLLDNTNTIARRSPPVAIELLERAVGSVLVHDAAREVLTARLARLRFWLGRRPEAEARAVLAMTADAGRAAEMRLILAYLDYSRGDVAAALTSLRKVADDPEVPQH
ncbi:MAG: BTAD domain-containing putative transcriptional regulator, partial [Thermocrispum sp.]